MKRCPIILLAVLLVGLFLIELALAEEKLFGGVGLQVVPTITGELVVLNVLTDSPAAEKGILPGDLIFRVGDFMLKGSEFGKVISEHLWGPVGSYVELFYRRPGVAGVNRVTLQRTKMDPHLTVSPTAQGVVPQKQQGQ